MSYSHIIEDYVTTWDFEQDYLNCRLRYLEYAESVSISFLEYIKMEEHDVEYTPLTNIGANDSFFHNCTIGLSTNTGFSTDLFTQVHPNCISVLSESGFSMPPGIIEAIKDQEKIDKKSIKNKEDIDEDIIKSRFEILDL